MTTRQVVTINGDYERERVSTWAKNVAIGTVVEFRKKSRSTEQNAKLHAMLGEVAEQVVWYGRKLDTDDWKNLFTASLRHSDVVPGIDKGTVVPLGIKTSSMTIDEMSDLIELIYAFGSDPEHHVEFKDPQQPTDSNPAGDAPSDPAVDDVPSSASESDGHPPAPSLSPLSDDECAWLVTVARMLWGCTPENPTEHTLEVLNNQRIAAGHLKPEPLGEEARNKAGSIYKRCKETVEGKHSRGDALRYIAGMAGCDVSEIGG